MTDELKIEAKFVFGNLAEFLAFEDAWIRVTTKVNPDSVNAKVKRNSASVSQAEQIRAMLLNGYSTKEIIEKLGATPPTISYNRGLLRKKGLLKEVEQ